MESKCEQPESLSAVCCSAFKTAFSGSSNQGMSEIAEMIHEGSQPEGRRGRRHESVLRNNKEILQFGL